MATQYIYNVCWSFDLNFKLEVQTECAQEVLVYEEPFARLENLHKQLNCNLGFDSFLRAATGENI